MQQANSADKHDFNTEIDHGSADSEQILVNKPRKRGLSIPRLPAQTLGRSDFVIGSRRSRLALKQTEIVCGILKRQFPFCKFSIETMETLGDQIQNIPLHNIDAKSLWTQDLENLLLAGQLDLIVHSLKDMPTNIPEGCELGAILERHDPYDAVVMRTGSHPDLRLENLPKGSVVGTSSVRRIAQLRRHCPWLEFEDVRGNIETRLRKLDAPDSPYTCLILANAGLCRLDLQHRVTQILSYPILLHAVGQGALGIEIRSEPTDPVRGLLQLVNHLPTTLACIAERSLMRTLEGGCSIPIGVQTDFGDNSVLHIFAIVVSVDGKEWVEVENSAVVDSAEAANDFGAATAMRLLEKGAGAILKPINSERLERRRMSMGKG